MKRLTAERMNGIKTGYWSASKKEELVQRLAEYENIGFEPEEIKGLVDMIIALGKMLMKEWIPVEKRLPETGEYVVGTNKYDEVLIYRYGWNSPHTKKMFFALCGAAADITAWMPLPEPYRPEGGETHRNQDHKEIAGQIL